MERSEISLWTKKVEVWAEKFYCPKIKTQGNGYHPDLELSDRSRERLEMRTHEYGYHPDVELSDRSRE